MRKKTYFIIDLVGTVILATILAIKLYTDYADYVQLMVTVYEPIIVTVSVIFMLYIFFLTMAVVNDFIGCVISGIIQFVKEKIS